MIKRAMLFTLTLLLMGGAARAQTGPTPPPVDYFIGSWGTVAFNDETDVRRMMQVAKGYCNQPYKIVKKTDKTFLMYVVTDLKEVETLVQNGKMYVIPVTPEGQKVYGGRELTVRDANTFSLKYIENKIHEVYGQNVFVRCGSR